MSFKKAIEELRNKQIIGRFPTESDEWIQRMWYTSSIKFMAGKSAPKVEKNICEYINLLGFQAEKRAVTGRPIIGKSVKTSLGTIPGKITYLPSTGTKGSADISSVIYGMAVLIEVKFGKDRQSKVQKEYESAIKKAGGFYFIAHNEDDFLIKFNELLNHPTMLILKDM